MSRMALLSSVMALAVGLSVLALGHAQLERLVGPERELFLYDGDLQLDSGGITVSSWGSGMADPVYDATYVGPQVLKVTSQGPYQGIVLHLGRAADLAEFLSSEASYLDLRMLPAQAPWDTAEAREREQQRLGRAGQGRGGTAGRGMGGGMRGGGMGRGMRGDDMEDGGRGGGGRRGGAQGAAARRGGAQAGRGGAPGAPGAPRGPQEEAFSLQNLRLVLFTDKGMVIADQVPVGVLANDQRGWTPVAVPLSQFQGIQEAASLRAIGVFADRSDVFYLGRARLVIDHTPVDITVKADPSMTTPDQLIDFSVELRGGPLIPQISWDFDEADGLQQQAFGPKVKHLYKRPGDFLATCTVTDRSGVRSPVTKAIGIRIETPG